ncbi:MAG: hypothetical protein WC477_06525 [Patescibacteria group bacterium]
MKFLLTLQRTQHAKLFALSVFAVCAVLIGLGGAKAASAGTCTYTDTGDSSFNTAANWSCNPGAAARVPGTGDYVVIPAAQVATLAANVTVASTTVSGTLNLGGFRMVATSTQSSGASIVVGTGGAGTLTFAGSGNTGSLYASGTISIVTGGIVVLNGGTMYLGSNWSDAGTFTSGTGTVAFVGTAAQSIGTEAGFYNLSISNTGATVTMTGNVTSTSLTVASGVTLAGAALRLEVSGAFTNAGTITGSGVFNLPGTWTNTGTITNTGSILHTADVVAFTDSAGTAATSYTTPATVYFKVTDPNRNTDGTTAQSFSITLTMNGAAGADSEAITLTETTVSSGIFTGSKQLIPSNTTTTNNSLIEISNTGSGSFTYTDAQDSADTSTQTATLTYYLSTSNSATTNSTTATTGGGGVGSTGYIPVSSPATVTNTEKDTRLANLTAMNVATNSLLKLQDDGNAATQEDSAVYYIGTDGSRHAFPNAKVYSTWFVGFSNIKIVSASDLASIPLGVNVRYKPGVRMVKFTTDPKVYAVAMNGNLRWVETEALASALYGTDWNTKIDDIPDTFYTNYIFGQKISSASDFNVSQQTSSASTISVDIGA